MPRTLSITAILALVGITPFMLAVSAEQPSLPTGHPAVSTPEKAVVKSNADPADVQSVDAIIDAYYASVSGAKGVPRDWERFLSLFMPDAQLIVSRTVDGQSIPLAISPQEFVASNRTYFEKGGYFESDIHRESNEFGHIAQVFSTYASRRALEDPEPYSRGINSMLLMNTGDRWWITTVMWESEYPETNPIPQQFLPTPDGES